MKSKIFTTVFFLIAGLLTAQDIEVPQNQKSLVTKLTATWCSICGDAAWDIYSNLVDNLEGKAIVLAAHYSSISDLHSSAAVDLIGAYKGTPSGQPIFYYNRDRISSNVQNQMTNQVNAAAALNPLAQTGILLEYDLTNKELVAKTRTRFFEPAIGDYYLSVLLVEKEVTAFQSNRSANARHKRVLRQAMTTETLGELIASGTIQKNASYDKTVRVAIPSSDEATRYQVVTILWEKTDTGREFVNANFNGQISEFVTSTLAVEAQPVTLSVQPNPTDGQAEVRIQAPGGLKEFRLHLYSAAGQLLRTWQAGHFSGGEQNISLDRQMLPQAGVYFLQLISEEGILNQKLVVN